MYVLSRARTHRVSRYLLQLRKCTLCRTTALDIDYLVELSRARAIAHTEVICTFFSLQVTRKPEGADDVQSEDVDAFAWTKVNTNLCNLESRTNAGTVLCLVDKAV